MSLTAETIRRLDVINVGGRQLRVVDLVAIRVGHKLVVFESGETLTMTPLTAVNGIRLMPYRSPWRRGNQLRGRR
ncbi:hypothetical protein [Streptomyces sp. NPDC049879]|uniref:hypothetical protein n=1 Tax=Streptomyces sp. NPDC049879 TaxID=3365598 RepID=UPI0037ACB1E7